ncbi:DUF2125 domain-containing protein [Acidiphilium sp. AL]|uniref:DUF2125 domain-containing protein n=1 Tax=Acidiphilium sp. AL TaxID=2871704 RepID=UPI0021CB91C1|nr:DUF2125 domain-containing protein [Acidiphilium sp. AL]MCU4158605.1 DUF2125 domain-containing protein [Acidiphilium sp. AL]
MRGFTRFLLLLIVVLAIAYVAAWWYAEGRLGVAFRQQEAAFRKAGWTVSHGATARGASPLVARFSVADLTFSPPDRGMPEPSITLPNLNLDVHPASPFTLDLGLPLSWHMAMPSGPAFTIQFATLHDRYRFDPNALLDHAPDPLRAVEASFTDMRVDSADTNFTLVSIKSLTARGTRNPAAGKNATAITIHEKITGFALSPIFVTLGHLPFAGKIKSLIFDLDLSGPSMPALSHFGQLPLAPSPDGSGVNPMQPLQAMWRKFGPEIHDWAKAGGHGRYAIALVLGPLDAHAHGNFGFDKAVQPVSRSTLTADGLGEFLGDIASAYPAAVGAISTLTTETAPYMTKGPKGSQRLKADLALADGVLTANGRKTANVPKLVWPRSAPAAH